MPSAAPPAAPVPASLSLLLEIDALAEPAPVESMESLAEPPPAEEIELRCVRAATPLATAADAAPAEVDEDVEWRGAREDEDPAICLREEEEEVSLGRSGFDADRWNSVSKARRFVTWELCHKRRSGKNMGAGKRRRGPTREQRTHTRAAI